jgi:integrase
LKIPKGLYKRKNSWYFICYVNGQRVRRMGGTTMKEAEMVMASFKAKAAKRPHLLTSEKITFVELAQEYIEKYAIPMKSKSSVRTDKGLLLHHLVPFFGDYRIGEITKATFYEYRAARLKENVIGRDRLVSERTLNREAALLRGILSMAVEWDYLDVNLMSKVKMFHEEPRGKILPMGTLRELIDRAPLPLKHIIIVALNTGARKSEILSLTWDRVNLDTRFITLIKTKSKKNRMVYINDALLDLLSRLSKKTPFVFPGTGKRTSWILSRHGLA